MTSSTICPHHPACPGCPLLDRSYSETIALKSQRLDAALDAPALAHPKTSEFIGADAEGTWRARARMLIIPSATAPDELLGFYQHGSKQPIAIARCQAHTAELEDALQLVREVLFPHDALWRACQNLDARSSDAGVILTLGTTTPREDPSAAALIDAARTFADTLASKLPTVGVHLNMGGRANVFLSGEAVELRAPGVHTHTLGNGRVVEFSPEAFFQLNPSQLERAHAQMRAWLDAPPKQVIDLYCGVGTHALGIVADGGKVWGVDSNVAAIEAAARNASAAGIDDAEFVALRDDAIMSWLEEHTPTSPELVIVNPARQGLHWRVVSWLEKLRPQKLLYMSCNPDTLARDLIRLADIGLGTQQVRGLDMMPYTDQIEALAMLAPTRRPPRPHVESAYASSDHDKLFSQGVSGIKTLGPATWHAEVARKAPKSGRLPSLPGTSAVIHATRIDQTRYHSVIQLRVEGELSSDLELRQRLRAWGHPALGDERFGDRKANYAAKRHRHLDRVALHCERATIDGEELHSPPTRQWA